MYDCTVGERSLRDTHQIKVKGRGKKGKMGVGLGREGKGCLL